MRPKSASQSDDLQLISISRAASMLDCNPVTLRRKVAKGELRGYRVGPRMLRVERAQIDQLLRPIPTGGERAS